MENSVSSNASSPQGPAGRAAPMCERRHDGECRSAQDHFIEELRIAGVPPALAEFRLSSMLSGSREGRCERDARAA